MSAQVELLRHAKRELRRNPELSDTEIALACGVPQHIVNGWSDALPEAITIRAARREVGNGV